MNLKDCYAAFNGNYDEAMGRIPKESSLIKFLRKFKDNGDYIQMLSAVESGDYGTVFATTHNIKGMAANLSITALCKSVSELCEAVRNGEPSVDITPLVEKVKADYEMTYNAIGELED